MSEKNTKILDAIKGKDSKKEKDPAELSVVRDYTQFFLWMICFFLFFSTYVFQNFKIPTQSMENSLLIGDHITLNSMVFSRGGGALDRALMPIREPKRGDVVVFKFPLDSRERWVKRLIGLPGEKVDIHNDQVFINGEALDEDYIYLKSRLTGSELGDRDPNNSNLPMHYDTMKPGLENADPSHIYNRTISTRMLINQTKIQVRQMRKEFPETDQTFIDQLEKRLDEASGETIPEGFYLVMGDNRNRSRDCREWGLLPSELVEGRPYWVWWSYGEEANTHEAQGLGFLWVYARVPLRFFTHTHWDKCLTRIK
ncbi:signal peptidase I [Acanthopleuribacter pedis]|uniref:Signal peptidase I n=1 Tax=Acanthopleuribacter pedis TaxID=442870 RepID=A0A8J7Q356_9BACT|nr:signal peptidase I [Acanthopleuribacter pedis]MBO1317604.1 signal peptidase I [Acanthopleuribacter pedis]